MPSRIPVAMHSGTGQSPMRLSAWLMVSSIAMAPGKGFEGYETESCEVGAERHFRQRWIRRTSWQRQGANFTERALGMLSLPPCNWSLDVFQEDESVVDFWLHGDYQEALGDPNRYWRGATE